MPEKLTRCVSKLKPKEKSGEIDSAWGTCIGSLKKAGVIEKKGKHWVLTDKGKKMDESFNPTDRIKLHKMLDSINEVEVLAPPTLELSESTGSGACGAYQQRLGGVSKRKYPKNVAGVKESIIQDMAKVELQEALNEANVRLDICDKNYAAKFLNPNPTTLKKRTPRIQVPMDGTVEFTCKGAILDKADDSGQPSNEEMRKKLVQKYKFPKDVGCPVTSTASGAEYKADEENPQTMCQLALPSKAKLESKLASLKEEAKKVELPVDRFVAAKEDPAACAKLPPNTPKRSPLSGQELEYTLDGKPINLPSDFIEGEEGCPPVPDECDARYVINRDDSPDMCTLIKLPE